MPVNQALTVLSGAPVTPSDNPTGLLKKCMPAACDLAALHPLLNNYEIGYITNGLPQKVCPTELMVALPHVHHIRSIGLEPEKRRKQQRSLDQVTTKVA